MRQVGCKQRGAGICLAFFGLVLAAQHSTAQTLGQNPGSAASAAITRPSAPAPSLSLSNAFSTLSWSELTPEQKISLKPLEGSWKDLSDGHKRKWISLSVNYAKMLPSDQAKLHERMLQWAALSRKDREQARLNFAETQKIPPQQKNEHWQTYQALSPEEKQKLAKSAQTQVPRTALAAKPVTDGRLSQVPLRKHAGSAAIPASGAASSDNKTLLARPTPPSLPVSAAKP